MKITLIALDVPHSFTIDGYRVGKKATPGADAVIEFHAGMCG